MEEESETLLGEEDVVIDEMAKRQGSHGCAGDQDKSAAPASPCLFTQSHFRRVRIGRALINTDKHGGPRQVHAAYGSRRWLDNRLLPGFREM